MWYVVLTHDNGIDFGGKIFRDEAEATAYFESFDLDHEENDLIEKVELFESTTMGAERIAVHCRPIPFC